MSAGPEVDVCVADGREEPPVATTDVSVLLAAALVVALAEMVEAQGVEGVRLLEVAFIM